MRPPDETDGVFSSFERRRTMVRKARWKTVGALAAGAVLLNVAMRVLPETTVRGLKIPLIVPLAWCSIGAAGLFFAGRSLMRLASGRYRSGKTDFGLPDSKAPRGGRRDVGRRS